MKYLSHDDGIELLTQLLVEERLVPIFGSGFTKGSQSYRGTVPDGKKCTKLMGNILKKYNTSIPEDQIEQFNFNEMARRFRKARNRFIPEKDYINFFEDYFTQTNLEPSKRNFLNLPWPFAFTLNIDDAIENCGTFERILPYQNFRRDISHKKLLYKLHGDAFYEIHYAKDDNIIFDSDQYTQSLNSPSNQTMRESFSNAYKEFNLLFIGCSLQYEPDIKYIYNSIKQEQLDTIRVTIRTQKPNALEEDDLEDYGINNIILVNDFDLFYLDFYNALANESIQEKINAYPFTNPSVEIIEDKDFKYFSGFRSFNENENKFYKSNLFVEREYIKIIRKSLDTNLVIFLEGRRFSGKTAILCYLCETEKKRTILFFPSTSLESYDVIYKLLQKHHNALFIFDSNSLSHETYYMLQDSVLQLKQNNNRLIITLNQSDNYLSEIIDSEYITIDNFFSDNDLTKLISLTNNYGFAERTKRNTNLDYLEIIKKEQEIKILSLKLPNRYSFNEHLLILLLSVKDKVYSRDIRSLKISESEITSFLERTNILIEKVKTAKGEKNTFSVYKLVHNSKNILLSELRKLTPEDTLKAILHIVITFKNGDNNQKRIYREVMQFDTLNQVFGRKKGAGKLIFEVYNSLEKELKDDLHFWLQRSKSIYRLMPTKYYKLRSAYAYAKKVYLDSKSENLTAKSALTLSLICSLLYELEHEKGDKIKRQREAINLGYTAILSSYYKQEKRLKNDLGMENPRKNYVDLIVTLCNNYILASSNQEDQDLKNKAFSIITKLNN